MFNFKLQTILDVRKTLEDEVLFEFSEQQKEVQKEEVHLLSIRQKITVLIDVLRNIQGKTVSVFDISMNTAGIKYFRVQEDAQKQRVDEAIKLMNIKKEALLEAMKKRKAIEIIKTKHYEKYQFDANLLERTANDEMSIVRHIRREER
jgi:flagellar FliJ protein